jgi:S-adenosylmethionine synthetase
LATHCEVCLSYAIGVTEQTSILINTFDTGVTSEQEISQLVNEVFDLRPG